MPIRDQPDGDWEARLILGAPCSGPMVLVKGCCFPCWGLGDLAGMRGESCIKWACFFMLPPLNCICHYKLRRQIKEENNIGARMPGCLMDALIVTLCSCCAIIQETKQVRRG